MVTILYNLMVTCFVVARGRVPELVDLDVSITNSTFCIRLFSYYCFAVVSIALM